MHSLDHKALEQIISYLAAELTGKTIAAEDGKHFTIQRVINQDGHVVFNGLIIETGKPFSVAYSIDTEGNLQEIAQPNGCKRS